MKNYNFRKTIPPAFFLVGLVLSSACKKNSTANNPAPPSANTTQVNGVMSNVIYLTNSAPDSSIYKSVIVATSGFFEPAIDGSAVLATPYADVGEVYVNSVKAIKNFAPLEYDATVPGSFPITYSITGNGNFVAATFVDSGSLAAGFSNYAQFPDVISKSAGLTFTLNNLANTTAVKLTINNLSFDFSGNIINISPAQLSALNTGTLNNIEVKCTGVNTAVLNGAGKTYVYKSTFLYSKTGYAIVP